MSRSGETEYDSEVDIDGLLSDEERADRQTSTGEREQPATAADTETSGGLRSRLPSPSLPSPGLPGFSLGGLALSLAVCVAAFLAAGVVVPLGGVAGLVGVFGAAFLLGLLGRGRYLELVVAGAGTAAVGALLDQLLLAAVADIAAPLAAISGAAGLLVAVIGCYLGRDLRAGLTQSVG
ncbi:hypothetical protein DP107_06435 [Haloglomus irregulare]|jgi:hypothetical protein|uniref:Uncharacterized protein n=1 Tax=Haloglomus irregulare TaxID=2234134 RepID=A0A554NC78_9EURY|nr:hypothetical protein [Haloglomus irregulare]TSD14620.1 hypothetical protein DP107_06435 [Haloglomus irregulare]